MTGMEWTEEREGEREFRQERCNGMLFDVITQFVMGDDDGLGLTAIGMRCHSEHQDVCGRSNVSLSVDKLHGPPAIAG
jgi:hypothetical protein